MTLAQHKPFSEREAKRKQRQQPANRIKAADRQRLTFEEMEAELQRRRNRKNYYESR